MKKIIFLDRDGTLVKEPEDYQIDSFDKVSFMPGVFQTLNNLAKKGYKFVMVTNQDGLGTSSFPEATFWPVHNFIINTFLGENIIFEEVFIDHHNSDDNHPNRKPGIGMVTHLIDDDEIDFENSYVVGDRLSDVLFARNLGVRSIFIGDDKVEQADFCAQNWYEIDDRLQKEKRISQVKRKTHETEVFVELNLDGEGRYQIDTGLGFFDHMLEQTAKHACFDLVVQVKGDLHVDEHHSIEDTAICLGEALSKALGDKKGIERYGFLLPMDDSLCQIALDLSGRPWISWDANFKREKIGDMPTELIFHFFKSLVDNSKINLHVKADGLIEHHKVEAIFKAFGKALKMAAKKGENEILPSTKGVI